MLLNYFKGIGAVSYHVLRRVYRQDKAEADNVLQNHRHAYNVNAGRFKLLQNGDNNGYNCRGKPGGTGKAHVDYN